MKFHFPFHREAPENPIIFQVVNVQKYILHFPLGCLRLAASLQTNGPWTPSIARSAMLAGNNIRHHLSVSEPWLQMFYFLWSLQCDLKVETESFILGSSKTSPAESNVIAFKFILKTTSCSLSAIRKSCKTNILLSIKRNIFFIFSAESTDISIHIHRPVYYNVHFQFMLFHLSFHFSHPRVLTNFYNRYFYYFHCREMSSRNDIFVEKKRREKEKRSKLDTQFSAPVNFILCTIHNFCVFGLGDIKPFF